MMNLSDTKTDVACTIVKPWNGCGSTCKERFPEAKGIHSYQRLMEEKDRITKARTLNQQDRWTLTNYHG